MNRFSMWKGEREGNEGGDGGVSFIILLLLLDLDLKTSFEPNPFG
jgi:hypothetical protein